MLLVGDGIPLQHGCRLGDIRYPDPHAGKVRRIDSGEADLVINTPRGRGARADGWEIRSAAVARGIPCITTLAGGVAAARAIAAARRGQPEVLSLQEIHAAALAQ